MKIIKLTAVFVLSILSFISCKEEDDIIQPPQGAYENGFFVLNEGNFGSGNASLTYVSDDYLTVEQNVYKAVNGRALGDTAQSIFTYDDKAYIILNASNKIEVVNRYTMKSITSLEGDDIQNPRFMVVYNGFGFVSNWGDASDSEDDFITVIDIESNTIIDTIPVGEGPEKMILAGNNLYVALKGGWNSNNKIVVIDTATNSVVSQIEVGDNPNALYKSANDLYVLSGGISYPDNAQTAGSITKIDLTSNAVGQTWIFDSESKHPVFLVKNENDFYFHLDGHLFKWDGTSNLPTTPESGLDGFYYGLSIGEGHLFTLNAGDYTSEGSLKIFDLNDNSEIKSITTGIIPNSVVFN